MRESRTGTFRRELDLRPFTAYPKCADLEDPEVMQPYEETSNSSERALRRISIERAKRVCVGCAAFPECRSEIDRLENMIGGDQVGVWAGETHTERKERRRKSRHAGSVAEIIAEDRLSRKLQRVDAVAVSRGDLTVRAYQERWA